MKRYEISISEIGEEEKTIGKDWEPGAAEDGQGYGYTPQTKAVKPYEREVYRQTVDNLDLAAVVSTINGIEK